MPTTGYFSHRYLHKKKRENKRVRKGKVRKKKREGKRKGKCPESFSNHPDQLCVHFT